MNALEILMNPTLAPKFAALESALAGKAEASAEASTEGKTVSQRKRELAIATADAGITAEEAREALELYLNGRKVKAAAAHGNHLQGYRAMLDDGIDIMTGGSEGNPVTDADAQLYIASDDVKELRAVRKSINQHIAGLAKLENKEPRRNAIDRLRVFAAEAGISVPQYGEAAQEARKAA